MFSRRTGWNLAANRLAAALESRRREGRPLLDLTLTNPARAGLLYPETELADALTEGAVQDYDPSPRGAAAAREAVALAYLGRGFTVDPGRIVVTASTSEAYAWLFKLLTDPGDCVLIPRPSYPLFEFLATLESTRVASYPLRYDGRWGIDLPALAGAARAESRLRAIVVVSPNNPTGSYLGRSEYVELASLSAACGAPIVCDEVFSTFPLAPEAGAPGGLRLAGSNQCDAKHLAALREGRVRVPEDRLASMLERSDAPAFVLDGLSKSAGLPGLKLGWIVVAGPPSFADEALGRLETIADTYLSVGAPVQRALPRLIEIGAAVSRAIQARTRSNLAALMEAAAGTAVDVLRAEGGWSAVLRVPRTKSEEDWCLALLERDGVVVQPGWFFDFEEEAFLVVSLLTPESVFGEAIGRLLESAGAQL